MELSNSFVVDAPVERTWQVLTDLERVAPCLPGATLTGIDGEGHHGRVRIKVGPVTAQYEGIARFAERDDAAHAAVIRAEARESRGQGGASATISARLTEHGDGTHVALLTDLALSGRVAQFGRGVISDVSGKLIGQFADRLEHEITQDGASVTSEGASSADDPAHATAASARPAGSQTSGPTPPGEQGGLDVLTLVGPVLRRAAPAAGAAVLALITGLLLGRRGRSRTGGRRPDGLPAAPVIVQLVLPSSPQKENA